MTDGAAAPVDLRALAEEDVETFRYTVGLGFGAVLGEEDARRAMAVFRRDRAVAAYAGDRIVGTAWTLPFELTLPGGAILPVGGLTGVTVHATHRRQGLLRRMLRGQLDEAIARGEVLALLQASEGAIYGRFGYGPATFVQTLELDRGPLALRDDDAWAGEVRLVRREAVADVLAPLYDAVRRGRHGFLDRSSAWWKSGVGPEWGEGPQPLVALATSPDGHPQGYATYVVRQADSRATLDVGELFARTEGAERALWRVLLQHDLVDRVVAPRRPIDDPLAWQLVDHRHVRRLSDEDWLWVRLLDLPRALAARRYEHDGSLVLQVRDPFLGTCEGVWRLDVRGGHGAGRRTTEPAQLALDVSDLGAAYLGGVRLSSLAAAGRVREIVPGAACLADALLVTARAPWCPVSF